MGFSAENEDGSHREEHREALNRIEEKVRSCFYYQTDSLKALKQIRDICDEEIRKDEAASRKPRKS